MQSHGPNVCEGNEHLVTLLIGFHRHRQNFGGTNQIGEVCQMYNIQRASLSDHIFLMYWSHDQYLPKNRLDTTTHINFFTVNIVVWQCEHCNCIRSS